MTFVVSLPSHPGLAVGSADGLILAGNNSLMPISYRKTWSSLAGTLRCPDLRVHDTRLWVAASLMRNGVGLGVPYQILGHRDQTMLLRRHVHQNHMSVCQLRCSIQLGQLLKINELLCGAEKFEGLLMAPSSLSGAIP